MQSAAGIAGGLVASAALPDAGAQQPAPGQASAPPPGQPPAFATAPAVGPQVSATTFAEAEKLVRVEMTAPQLAQAAESWRVSMAPLYERRTGPRKVALEDNAAPWSTVRAVQPGMPAGPERDRFIRSQIDPGPLPASDADIAWAPVTRLSRWIEQRKLSSERLTKIYLDRLRRYDP
ncbi:MAG TPA: amidase, partial [Terracidiphilus sp.]